MLDWILFAICVVLVIMIVYQLASAVNSFHYFQRQLSGLENAVSADGSAITTEIKVSAPPLPDETADTVPYESTAPRLLSGNAAGYDIIDIGDMDEEINAELSWVASKQGTRFHRIECSSVKRIRENNRQYFNSRDEAVSSGYEPCKICKPE